MTGPRDVYVYPKASNPRPPVELGGVCVMQGLAFSSSGTVPYAVAETANGSYVLHTLPGQQTAST